MKNSLRALMILGLLASGLQAAPRPQTVTVGSIWLEDLDPPTCRVGASAETPTVWGAPMQVYRDPQTGRFVAPPPTLRVELPRVLEVRPRALVESRVVAPGGGVRVELSHRFATALVARRGAEGEIEMECAHPPASANGESEPSTREERR